MLRALDLLQLFMTKHVATLVQKSTAIDARCARGAFESRLAFEHNNAVRQRGCHEKVVLDHECGLAQVTDHPLLDHLAHNDTLLAVKACALQMVSDAPTVGLLEALFWPLFLARGAECEHSADLQTAHPASKSVPVYQGRCISPRAARARGVRE